MLAPFTFAHISKSTLVTLDCAQSIQAEFSGNYRIKLKNRKEVLSLSRKYFKEFKERI
jgi:DNA-binding LytR/AlgR family response regulator